MAKVLESSMITAKTIKINDNQIHQCDIFVDIDVIERVYEENEKLIQENINFPFIICLNQECDLVQNYNNPKKYPLLHLLIAPVFLFDSYLAGNYWEGLFPNRERIKEDKDRAKLTKQNEIPRYHYLEFPQTAKLPRLIIDFKCFFTINRDYLYQKVETNRLCSIDNLFKEKISQRFSFFLSRIGLPEV